MSTCKTKKPSAGADALRMLEPLSRDDPAMQEMLAEERSHAAVARQIYELRTARGLTQQQLPELIRTKQPVIARLEDADYEGHSLAMLYRIGAALGCRGICGAVSGKGKKGTPGANTLPGATHACKGALTESGGVSVAVSMEIDFVRHVQPPPQ